MGRHDRELAAGMDAVRAAARVCRAVASRIVGADQLEKKDQSPVTVADFASQAIVCQRLERAFPADPVVGEDQGIGGRVGTIVGHKLWDLGHSHQVLCVTRLPQLAAFADQHLHVSKAVQDASTTTHVQSLNGDGRLRELALMMGEVSEGTLHSARDLLDTVRRAKAQHR